MGICLRDERTRYQNVRTHPNVAIGAIGEDAVGFSSCIVVDFDDDDDDDGGMQMQANE